jgi:hypothetical protein
VRVRAIGSEMGVRLPQEKGRGRRERRRDCRMLRVGSQGKGWCYICIRNLFYSLFYFILFHLHVYIFFLSCIFASGILSYSLFFFRSVPPPTHVELNDHTGNERQFYIRNPFLFFIFYTLPPPCLYILSCTFTSGILSYSLFLFTPFHVLLRFLRYRKGGRTDEVTIVARKNFSCRRSRMCKTKKNTCKESDVRVRCLTVGRN